MPDDIAKTKQPQSMARRIRQGLLFVGLLSVVLTALGASALFYRAFSLRAETALADIARAAAARYDGSADSLRDVLLPGGMRLTLIGGDGAVLLDSAPDEARPRENHADRPEVLAALQNGVGTATRRSATVGVETHYYALRLPDGCVLRAAQDTAALWTAYNRMLPLLAAGCAAVAALAAVLAWFFARRLVAPVTALAGHLDTIEADVPYTELVPLARTIQSDRRLRAENEQIRREFTANVSHELKTPLTSISGYAELLETGMARPEDVPAFGRRIHREAQRMIRLVSDILQLSELDSLRDKPERAPEMAPLDLAELARDTVAAMTVNARKAYVTLSATALPAPVTGSRDLLAELLQNLCDNAIRYNRPGGHVLLYTGTAEGRAFLRVEDNGIGIPPEAQDRVFERFYRVDKSRSKATGGTGLGLAIVKHIALLHGADITLTSAPGAGTAVQVTFPKAPA